MPAPVDSFPSAPISILCTPGLRAVPWLLSSSEAKARCYGLAHGVTGLQDAVDLLELLTMRYKAPTQLVPAASLYPGRCRVGHLAAFWSGIRRTFAPGDSNSYACHLGKPTNACASPLPFRLYCRADDAAENWPFG